jgi:hypothetical protein
MWRIPSTGAAPPTQRPFRAAGHEVHRGASGRPVFAWQALRESLTAPQQPANRAASRTARAFHGVSAEKIGAVVRHVRGEVDAGMRRSSPGRYRPAGASPRRRSATVLDALDVAAEYKRDRDATCPDCEASPAELCSTCEWRLARADEYDALAETLRGQDGPQNPPGIAQSGGGWISGPCT